MACRTGHGPRDTTWKYLDASAYPAYARTVAAFAARYSGSVGRIIVWNEPNLSIEWGGRKVDPAGYAAMLKAVYPVVKAANPHVEVVAAGLAPTVQHRRRHGGSERHRLSRAPV